MSKCCQTGSHWNKNWLIISYYWVAELKYDTSFCFLMQVFENVYGDWIYFWKKYGVWKKTGFEFVSGKIRWLKLWLYIINTLNEYNLLIMGGILPPSLLRLSQKSTGPFKTSSIFTIFNVYIVCRKIARSIGTMFQKSYLPATLKVIFSCHSKGHTFLPHWKSYFPTALNSRYKVQDDTRNQNWDLLKLGLVLSS